MRSSRSGPIRTRVRRWTGCPTASHIRRTWRLRPSRIVSISTADCAADQTYEFLFTAPPLNITRGTGSPINPLAIK